MKREEMKPSPIVTWRSTAPFTSDGFTKVSFLDADGKTIRYDIPLNSAHALATTILRFIFQESQVKHLTPCPWDWPVNKLIIDLGRFALVDDENNLIGEGKVSFESIARLAQALKVNPDQVYIDMGGPDMPGILELCKRNGFTPVKGTSTGVIKQIEVQGLTAFLIDHKKPPFSFL